MNNDETFGNFASIDVRETGNDDLRELAQSTLDMVIYIYIYIYTPRHLGRGGQGYFESISSTCLKSPIRVPTTTQKKTSYAGPMQVSESVFLVIVCEINIKFN